MNTFAPSAAKEIYRVYHGEGNKVSVLAKAYHVSGYNIIRHGGQHHFSIHKNIKRRFCRLNVFVRDRSLAKGPNKRKDYSGQMLHVDPKRLPLLKGETAFGRRDYLFWAIDDFSRQLGNPPRQNQGIGRVFAGTGVGGMPMSSYTAKAARSV